MSELRRVDLTGCRFGRLLANQRAGKTEKGLVLWSCLCDCGSTTIVKGTKLRLGSTQSCGCLRSELASQRESVDRTGQKFGMLTFIERRGSSENHKAIWLCRCDCGQEKTFDATQVAYGRVISCGCVKFKKLGILPKRVREMNAVKAQRRRARELNADGSFTSEQITELYAKQKGRCANCSEALGDEYHRDHRTPLARGGTNDILNIELLCGPCNLAKHAKDPVDWAQENGRLL